MEIWERTLVMMIYDTTMTVNTNRTVILPRRAAMVGVLSRMMKLEWKVCRFLNNRDFVCTVLTDF